MTLSPAWGLARSLWHEKLAGGELNNTQLDGYFDPANGIVKTLHVLKDGSDSVGLLGALNRVYLNIGLFSEEWLTHFNPVVGGKPITPIEIAIAQKNSTYWLATEAGTPNTALFFLKAAQPDHLTDAPEGYQYLNADAKLVAHGKEVFADTCARCQLEQGTCASTRPEPRRGPLLRLAVPGLLQALLDVEPIGSIQVPDAGDCGSSGFSGWELSVDGCADTGDAVAHERVQPAGDQRDRGEYLGQLLVSLIQTTADRPAP